MSESPTPPIQAPVSPEEKILYDTKSGGRIAYITLNNPTKANAIDKEMVPRLLAVLKDADQDNKVKVVVIKSAGNRSFCTGWDLSLLTKLTPEIMTFILTQCRDVSRTIAFLKKPVVVQMQGSAIGEGCVIALVADFRIVAKKDGLYFLLPEMDLGAPGATGTTSQSIAALGLPRSKRMMLTAEKIPLDTMNQWGLITKVVAPENLDEEVKKFCRGLIDKNPVLLFTQKVMCNIMGIGMMKPFYDLENEVAEYVFARIGQEHPADLDAFLKGLWAKYGSGAP